MTDMVLIGNYNNPYDSIFYRTVYKIRHHTIHCILTSVTHHHVSYVTYIEMHSIDLFSLASVLCKSSFSWYWIRY